MIVVISDGGVSKNYPEMTKEAAMVKFGDEVKEGGCHVISIEGSYVEELKEVLDPDNDEEVIVEWEEIGADFSKE